MFPATWGTDLVTSALTTFGEIIGQFYGVLGVFAAAMLVGVIISVIVRRS